MHVRFSGALVAAILSLSGPAAGAAGDTPPPPPPDWPSGCEPARPREPIAGPGSAAGARACGIIRLPWAYRGPLGRPQSMRSYGRRPADAAWAGRLVAMLLDSTRMDTIYRVPGTEVSCDPARVTPVYLVH